MNRRTLSILTALVLCLCVLASCGSRKTAGTDAGTATDAGEAGAAAETAADKAAETPAETPAPTVAPLLEEEATETDAFGPEDYVLPASPADAAEPDADEDAYGDDGEGDYVSPGLPDEPDAQPIESGLPSVLDVVTGSSDLTALAAQYEGAGAILADIQQRFSYLADDSYTTATYECYVNNNIFSLVITEDLHTDSVYYTPYNLDLDTGAWLDGAGLLKALGLDEDDVAAAELAALEAAFDDVYADLDADAMGFGDFLAEQRARTISEENVDFEHMWLDADGHLVFAGKIYSIAGAERYEHILDTGYAF